MQEQEARRSKNAHLLLFSRADSRLFTPFGHCCQSRPPPSGDDIDVFHRLSKLLLAAKLAPGRIWNALSTRQNLLPTHDLISRFPSCRCVLTDILVLERSVSSPEKTPITPGTSACLQNWAIGRQNASCQGPGGLQWLSVTEAKGETSSALTMDPSVITDTLNGILA
jgi:hypothetical protein